MRSFSIYVHIPYCRVKCPYCDFNVYAATRWPEKAYTAAVVAELRHYAQHPPWNGGCVQSIFFGGGTPSLFAPESIAEVAAAVAALWRLTDGRVEISLEANPGTVTSGTLQALRAAGVNRISLGVQSFHSRHLARLGRDHGADEARAAVALAQAAGFEGVSLDLIFAIPGQTLAEWEADLGAAIGLAPHHISAYNLTFEERTPFHAMRAKGQLSPLPDDIEAAMFVRADEILGAAGYRHYEISNYARPGHESLHNANYWRTGEYLGAGAGAHSFCRLPPPGIRWSNELLPQRYIDRIESDGHARIFEERLTDQQARGEFVFLGLRELDGFDAGSFAARFGIEFLTTFPHAAGLQRDGLLAVHDTHWCLTERGRLLADTVFASFV